jgi:hypothetical protein
MSKEFKNLGSGIAGNSARKQMQRKFKNSKRIKSWEKGAIGEEFAGKVIEEICAKYDYMYLHDRKIPKSSANIDHILITDRGVFVIDTKNYKGAVRIKEEGGLFRPVTETLMVGSRNQTKLVLGIKKQVEIIESAILEIDKSIPVFGVLAFYDANWPILFKPKQISDVLINSKGIEASIISCPVLSGLSIKPIFAFLDEHFKAR